MTRSFLLAFTTLCFLATFIVDTSPAYSQELLLELPSSSTRTSPTNALKILSPNEISDLYRESPSSNAPTAAPNALPQKTEKTATPVTKQDSFSQLIQDLATENLDQSPDRFDINTIWSRKSAMLLPAEVKTFNAAIRRHLRLKNQPVIAVEAQDPEAVVAEAVPAGRYPFIALCSIMYAGPDNWAAWVNGKRYTPLKTESLAGITVERVTKDTISMRWRQAATSQTTTTQDNGYGIQETVTKVSGPTADSLPENIEKVDDRTYIITLSSNQAFITQDFEIHEGRVATKRISEIYQQQLALKQAALDDLAGLSRSEAAEPDPFSIQEEKDKEDIAKLLEIYRNSETQNQ